MTRKDFELIADAIKNMKDSRDGEDWTINGAMYPFAVQLADALEDENPRFDREKFLRACGINPIFTERMFSKEGVML